MPRARPSGLQDEPWDHPNEGGVLRLVAAHSEGDDLFGPERHLDSGICCATAFPPAVVYSMAQGSWQMHGLIFDRVISAAVGSQIDTAV
jgi:hypothetical protein